MNKNVIVIVSSIVIAGLCISGSIIYVKSSQNNNQVNWVKQSNIESGVISEKQIIQQLPEKPKSNQVELVHILQIIPQYSIVSKQVPYKHCENINETIIVTRQKQDGSTGGTVGGVTGAVAGAVIGKQLSGNDGGTAIGGVIGAVAGAIAGNQIEKTQTEQVPQLISKRVCSTQYNTVTHKNLSAYKVIYEYNDQRNNIITRKKPYGDYVPINTLI